MDSNQGDYGQNSVEYSGQSYTSDIRSNFSNEDLISYKEQQIKAIQEMNFEKANELQQKIFDLSDQQSNEIIEKYCAYLKVGCDKVAKEYSKRRRAALAIQNRNEINIRRSITDEFIEKQNSQIQALKNLEEELFEQFKVLMNRPIEQCEDLNKRALQAGFSGDFELATELRDESKKVQNEKLMKRKEEFEENYKKQVNNLLDKQRQELSELQLKLSQNIILIEKQRKQMIDNESENFKKKIIHKYNRITRKAKLSNSRQGSDRDSVVSGISSQFSSARSSKSFASEGDEEENNLPAVPSEIKKILHKELANTFKEICTKFGFSNIQGSSTQ